MTDEALGEALYGLSARLLLTKWLDDPANHAAYEEVVKAFNAPFIAKPDPLVEAMHDCGVDRFESWADQLRAALAARGLEIREVDHD